MKFDWSGNFILSAGFNIQRSSLFRNEKAVRVTSVKQPTDRIRLLSSLLHNYQIHSVACTPILPMGEKGGGRENGEEWQRSQERGGVWCRFADKKYKSASASTQQDPASATVRCHPARGLAGHWSPLRCLGLITFGTSGEGWGLVGVRKRGRGG